MSFNSCVSVGMIDAGMCNRICRHLFFCALCAVAAAYMAPGSPIGDAWEQGTAMCRERGLHIGRVDDIGFGLSLVAFA